MPMRRIILLSCLTLLVLPEVLLAQNATHLVVSELYGGGGNSGSSWTNDFIELYNPTDTAISVTGWSVQYASASGTSYQVTPLSGFVPAKGFYLVQEAQGSGGTQSLPTPDAIGTIAMSGTSGKVALASKATAISGISDAAVVDFVGYGTATLYEGTAAAPILSNTTSAERKATASSSAASLGPGGLEELAGNGLDTDNNNSDFVAQSAITPQSSLGPREPPVPPLAGSGTASVEPRFVSTFSPINVRLALFPDTSADITKLRLTIPSLFTWSQSASDVSVDGPGSPAAQVDADTITVTGFVATALDSVILQIQNLSAPDTTVGLALQIETAAGIDSTAPIASAPVLVLTGSARPIAELRQNDVNGIPLLLNEYVTVRGIVTVAGQFQGPAYLQDVSGGLAVFDIGFESAVAIGDEVTITGWIDQFRGLTELRDVLLHEVHSGANNVQPLELTANAIAMDGAGGTEQYEGALVRLNQVVLTALDGTTQVSTWDGSGSGQNYLLTDQSGSVQIRVDNNVDFVGAAAPQGPFDVIGVVSQFVVNPPYVGGYQLMPRWRSDILSSGPIIAESPREIDITSHSLRIIWTTVNPGTSGLRFGKTPAFEVGTVEDSAQTLSHSLLMDGLESATVYYVEAFSADTSDTSTAGTIIVSTASEGSTGDLRVYFNKSIDASASSGEIALGGQNLVDRVVGRIDSAQHSIDVCLYSLSGTPGPGDTVADALIRAHTRGVSVRAIGEKDNQSTAPWTKLKNAGIPVIDDGFDPVTAGFGLMHSKFLVIDARDTVSALDDWVWTGSWNITDPGTNNDMQNVIVIQDQALARAYTLEFNEMWGSDTDTPSAASSRFGSRKRDNTPHRFVVGSTSLELYFSPSDRTTQHIVSAIDGAEHSVNVALLTFTRSDLAGALVARRLAGVRVRGILDNNTDMGSQFAFLQANGAEMLLDPSGAFLHHKYAVIDAENTAYSGVVITGSHNWTNSAENSNNENTLIVHSDRVANLYLQEFKARYAEAGGGDSLTVGVESAGPQVPEEFQLSPNYPNPFNPSTRMDLSVPVRSSVSVVVYDLLGRRVSVLVDDVLSPGVYALEWNARGFSAGVYLVRATVGARSITRKALLIE